MHTKLLLSLSLCLLVASCSAHPLGWPWQNRRHQQQQEEQQQFSQCDIQKLTAAEPSYRVRAEAGVIEIWDHQTPEFRCAGVGAARIVIQPGGLLQPSYTNTPYITFVEQGRGVLGVVVPGCPETFQAESESQSPRERGDRRFQPSRQEGRDDRHQKVSRIREGDVIAAPAGVVQWAHNDGDSELVTITLFDAKSIHNQLDDNVRAFFLAGRNQQNGSSRHQRQREEEQGGRRPQRQEETGESYGANILGGIDEEILREVFGGADRETISKIQGENDDRGFIVRAQDLQVQVPEESEEEQEREQERGQGRRRETERGEGRRGRSEEEEERGQEHGQGRRRETERGEGRRGRSEEEEEREQERGQGRRRETERGEGRRGRSEEEEEREQERGQGRRRETERGEGRRRHSEEEEEREREPKREHGRERESRGRGEGRRGHPNDVQESLCNVKFHHNINKPAQADIYNPRAGRISTVNSNTLPILEFLRLSAEHTVLYKGAIQGPEWNANAHSVVYVTNGEGRVQVVGDQGNTVFDDVVQRGQILVVPQGFAVVKKAGKEGLEWVELKTNDNAISSSIPGRASVFRAIPAEVLATAYDIPREEALRLKNARREVGVFRPLDSGEERERGPFAIV